MANYTVVLSKRTAKQLDKLQDNIAEPILEAIGNLQLHPRPQGYKKLVSREGYRIRIGVYRVIYSIFDAMLIVEEIEVGNRKEAKNYPIPLLPFLKRIWAPDTLSAPIFAP